MLLEVLLAVLVCPQEPSKGNFLGAAASIWVDTDTAFSNSNIAASHGLLKPVGRRDTLPLPHPNLPGHPDFSPTALPFALPNVEIGGFSASNNWIAAENGIASALTDGGDGWAAFLVSVSDDTIGPPGSAINDEKMDNGASGDVFQYVLPDSTGVADSLRGKTVRAIDSTEIRLNPISPTTPANVVALDMMLPLILGNPNIFLATIQEFHSIAFTIAPGSLNNVPASWFGNHKSAATVLVSRWLGTHWSVPTVLVTAHDLGLDPGVDRIVGVAWDDPHARLVVAVSPSTGNPLVFKDLSAGGSSGVYPLTVPGGEALASAMGVTPGGGSTNVSPITAITAIDPRILNWLRYGADPQVADSPVNASLFRNPSPTDELVAMMTIPGALPLAQGQTTHAILQVPIAGEPPLVLGVYPMEPSGSPQHVEARWPAPPTLLGVFASIEWVIWDSDASAILGQSAPISLSY